VQVGFIDFYYGGLKTPSLMGRTFIRDSEMERIYTWRVLGRLGFRFLPNQNHGVGGIMSV
jgi:hypothetical protein